ncbi:protein FAR1-RELATED SEQUENCE 5-like isoform X1 [Papaver somniferum]|uniref:protein FAR1-RELATED SEQUENCE 5-like isoform X1 n=1 Tax=Papaver somniferum TaxID=3469 RepID=UPI000E6FDCD8|nr:protein FAR1-RELATED SEQUENCE 5-like isoform X1 [Papaver somniferum]
MDTSGRSSNNRCSGYSPGNLEETVEQTIRGDIGQTLNGNQGELDKSNDVEVDLNKLEDLIYEGMVFESEERAFDTYNEVARRAGFSVRRDKLVKRANGMMRKRVFVCFKQGIRKKDNRYQYVRKERPQIRTGCMARMVIKYEKENKWVVTDIICEHNHPLPTTSKSYRLRPQRRTADAATNDLEGIDTVGISPADGSKQINGRQAEGHESVGNKLATLGNHIQSKRKILEKDEARTLLDYFTRKKMENPAFFYSMIVDKENQVTNLFWADARSIMDYNYFGDVVIFDTTYRTNLHGWPFAPFVGVNHHKQTVLFGGALILDESTESFIWLFETWMKMMSGRQPKTIITDHCATISKAISIVMTETHHRICLWHIFKNASKHLSHVYWMPGFLQCFSKCIYGYETEEEFIARWEKMLHDYKLAGTKWLDDLFNVREKWALVYGHDTFCADTTTTQHNKSINKFLKKFVKKKYSFTEFLARYERVLSAWRERELHEDFESIQTSPNLPFPAPMLKQAADKYTRAVFKMFAEEYKEWILCKVEDCGEDGIFCKYEVTQENRAKGLVTIDPSTCQVLCSCKKFEFVGILCRHAIKILYHRNIHDLPPHYILKRWSKDAKSGTVRDREGNQMQADSSSLISLRYNELLQKAINIVTKGSLNEESHLVASRALDNALLEVESATKATQGGSGDDFDTSLATQFHSGERVFVGEGGDKSIMFSARQINGDLDVGQKRRKTRNSFVDLSHELSMDNPHHQQGQNHRLPDGLKRNDSPIYPSLQIVSTPNSTPLPYTPVSLTESTQFIYPIIRPNLQYVSSPYTQGSSGLGMEPCPFITHSAPEGSYISNKPHNLGSTYSKPTTANTGFKPHQASFGEPRIPATFYPQPSSFPTRFESNQVLNPHGSLQPSMYMDLHTTQGALGIESSEESSDSDESQLSPLSN